MSFAKEGLINVNQANLIKICNFALVENSEITGAHDWPVQY